MNNHLLTGMENYTMEAVLISPAKATVFGIPTVIFSLIIPLVGVGIFTYMIALRLKPLVKSCPDPRLSRPAHRFFNMIKYAVGQYRHPRYMDAGIIHIILFELPVSLVKRINQACRDATIKEK